MARQRHDLAALAILAALALVFFWPVTLGAGWIPRGGGDLASFLWPTYSYAARSLWAGRLPLWNETLYAGMPFAADNQSGLFYPLNLLAFLLAPTFPYRAIEALVVFHFWLAGAAMYALMRAVLGPAAERPERGGALVAAIAFMFSDVLITHIGNLNIVAVAAWLPLALAGLHLAVREGRAAWAAAAGVALGVAALAGHAQMTLMSFAALGAYGLWLSACAGAGWRRALGLLALTVITALGLSAVALLPAVELTAHTARARLTYAEAANYSLPWAGLAGLFSPLVFGRGAQAFWAPWPRVELGYMGVLTLVFVGLARGRGRVFFWAALALAGVVVALGANTPVHRLLYDFVPGFAQLRVPARFLLWTHVGLGVLAGMGVQRWLADPPGAAGRRWAVGLGVATAVALPAGYALAAPEGGHGAAFWWGLVIALGLCAIGVWLMTGPRPLAFGLAVAVLALDVIGHGAGVEVEVEDPTRGFNHPRAVAFLQGQPAPTRIDVDTGAWAPDTAARHGLEDIGGLSNPLALARYQTYVGAMGPRGAPRYNFLGAQWIVAEKGRPPADDPDIVPVFTEDPAVDIWLNTTAMPRLNLIYAAQAVPEGDGPAAFAAIVAPSFDPARTVVVEAAEVLAGLPPAPPAEANLYYVRYSPEAQTIVAVTAAPAYLVLSEVWYPGWRAWVAGVEVPILRANFAFRAVPLPTPGEHVVELRFEPVSVRIGLALTALTGLALAGWAVWRWRVRP